MRTNRSIRLGIALIAGAFVLLLLSLLFRGRGSQTTVAQNTTTPDGVTPVSVSTGRRAAIAIQDIPERSIITPNMFRIEELPEDAPPGAYITDPEAQAIGFITRRRIPANRHIQMGDLVGHITEVGVAGALRPGTRAMTIALANKATFHDIVRIGDTVDIISAFDQAESRTIVEGVRVLAVDVFGKDYPQTSIAQRGDYKAPQRSIRTANPPSPAGGNAAGGAANTASTPDASGQPANGQPAPGQPAPAPTPTPSPTPPPPRPTPAIVVEVTPEQANRISLAQNSGGALDFIIVPFETPTIVPGGQARTVSVTRPQLAPYAESRKKTNSATASQERSMDKLTKSWERNVNTVAGAIRDVGGAGNPNLPLPAPGNTGVPPAKFDTASTTSAPTTYNIPVYVDGKRVRTDVVRKPEE